jgi:uncharacterized protein YecE (DUF72 family)
MKRAHADKVADVRIGVGGWTYEPWRGPFYPASLVQKRELEYASRQLTSIEINGTFYGRQKPETFAKWHDETPDDFVFAVKGPRFVTHRRELGAAADAIDRFFESGVLELKKKLGPINWQLAPTKQFDVKECESFFRLLPARVDGQSILHALEVRHQSFCNADFVALAREHHVAVVTAGDSRYPEIGNLTAPFVYARIMGTTESEPQGYSTHALDVWADRVRRWASGATAQGLQSVAEDAPDAHAGNALPRDVYLYVISGFKEHNPAAATALIERLRERA